MISPPFNVSPEKDLLKAYAVMMAALVDDKVPRKVPGKVPGKSELMILDILRRNPAATRKELSELTLLSESGIKKIIANLKSSGWIVRNGSDRSGYWEVLIEK